MKYIKPRWIADYKVSRGRYDHKKYTNVMFITDASNNEYTATYNEDTKVVNINRMNTPDSDIEWIRQTFETYLKNL